MMRPLRTLQENFLASSDNDRKKVLNSNCNISHINSDDFDADTYPVDKLTQQ